MTAGLNDTAPGCLFGIDGGGTRSRGALVSPGGRLLAREEGGSANIYGTSPEEVFAVIEELVKKLLDSAGRRWEHVVGGCLGAAGLGRERERGLFEKFFARLLPGVPVRLCSDGEILLCGGLGALEGYCLIAGTGSLALGRNASGEVTRAGGLGCLLGDEGAAVWLGRTAVARCLRSREGRDLPTTMLGDLLQAAGLRRGDDFVAYVHQPGGKARVAALAPVVTAAARRGDPLGGDILRAGVEELVLLVESVVRRTPEIRRRELVFAGGVLEGDAFTRGLFLERLAARLPGLAATPPRHTALEGACMVAAHVARLGNPQP